MLPSFLIPKVVVRMGSSTSEQQREQLVATPGSRGGLTLLLDADEAGKKCESQCIDELVDRVCVKVARLPVPHAERDHLSGEETSQVRQ